MIAKASESRPPPPIPCRPRKAISSKMFLESPQSALAIRNSTMASWNSRLRPYRSPALPQIGVEAVLASRYAVMTHDSRLLWWKSPTIVGRAVDTMVWSSEARNIPIISPDMITRICRCVKPSLAGGLAVVVAGELMSVRCPYQSTRPPARPYLSLTLASVSAVIGGRPVQRDSGRPGLLGGAELLAGEGLEILAERPAGS